MISIEEIDELALLARLELSSAEKETMRKEFDSILEYVAAINKVGADFSVSSSSVVSTLNVMREDANPHESGIFTEDLLALAPARKGQYIKVKKIL